MDVADMKLRMAIRGRQTPPHGPVERLVAFLALRGFTAFDALMVPFHLLFAGIMLVTPQRQLAASPVYGKLDDLVPIWFWAIALALFALAICSGLLLGWWMDARVGYIVLAAWWFTVSGLVYLAATTLLSPAVYVLIGIACLYRQAEIAVGYQHGGD